MKYLFFISLLLFVLHSYSQTDADMKSYTLVVHGGAGTLSKEYFTPEKEKAYHEALKEALMLGEKILKAGGHAIDAVEAVVVFLEDHPFFNAGKGSVMTLDGKFELDASIMNGSTMKAGAVAQIGNVKNPIKAARLVMDKTEHVFLSGKGAENFASRHGLTPVDTNYFKTEERWKQFLKMKEQQEQQKDTAPRGMIVASGEKYGTVGAVALDMHGNLAAATSTGGMMNKLHGRIGDSPLIGAGTYADNAFAAISCTGHGEFFIRSLAAYDVVAAMKYGKLTLQQATENIIHQTLAPQGGLGGLIAVDKDGNIAMPFSTSGMYRGFVKQGNAPQTFIFGE